MDIVRLKYNGQDLIIFDGNEKIKEEIYYGLDEVTARNYLHFITQAIELGGNINTTNIESFLEIYNGYFMKGHRSSHEVLPYIENSEIFIKIDKI